MTIVKSGLIQACIAADTGESCQVNKDKTVEKHLAFIEHAGNQGVQILCLQELFNGPYFCPSKDPKWFDIAEPIPDGPTTRLVQEYAQKFQMAIVSPIFEKDPSGEYFNTAAVIDADGRFLGKYRKLHIPKAKGQQHNFEYYYFKPGDLGFPVFKTAYATIGVYICFDRHFPEGARMLGLNGAQIVYIPSATWVSKSQYIWNVEQPALAVANAYFVGTINRVGMEGPWNLGRFYGSSYFVDPHGKIFAQACEDKDELLVADLDLDQVEEAREAWQWYHERRPELYAGLSAG